MGSTLKDINDNKSILLLLETSDLYERKFNFADH